MEDEEKDDLFETDSDEDQDAFAFEPDMDPDAASVAKLETGLDTDARLALAVKILRQLDEGLQGVMRLLEGGTHASEAARQLSRLVATRQEAQEAAEVHGHKRQVIEGVFDGRGMIGPDGKQYAVPSNYASKSRLVEGDALKLTIQPDGTFIFKQIAPVERKRCTGTLAMDPESGGFRIVCKEGAYRALDASVTYFKGEPGDEVVLLVPKNGRCIWAAVEHIVKR